MNPSHAALLARLATSRVQLPDLVERKRLPGLITKPPQVLALLYAGWFVCIGFQFAQFIGGQ